MVGRIVVMVMRMQVVQGRQRVVMGARGSGHGPSGALPPWLGSPRPPRLPAPSRPSRTQRPASFNTSRISTNSCMSHTLHPIFRFFIVLYSDLGFMCFIIFSSVYCSRFRFEVRQRTLCRSGFVSRFVVFLYEFYCVTKVDVRCGGVVSALKRSQINMKVCVYVLRNERSYYVSLWQIFLFSTSVIRYVRENILKTNFSSACFRLV